MNAFKSLSLFCALAVACCLGCGGSTKSTTADFTTDMSPKAISVSEFENVVIAAPVANGSSFLGMGGGPKERDAKFLITGNAAYVIPEAHVQRLTATPVGEVISCPKALFGTWSRVNDIYGQPAEDDLVKNLSTAVKPDEHGLRIMQVSSGPLAGENVVSYVGRAASGQEYARVAAATPAARTEQPYVPQVKKATKVEEASFRQAN